MLSTLLEALKRGEKLNIEWDFGLTAFFENADNDCEDYLDCYPIVHAVIKVGEHSIDIHRTFGACVYLTDGNLTTVSFNELEGRDWCATYDLDTDDEIQVFDSLIAHIQLNHGKALMPDYSDMSADDRQDLQDEAESYLESL